MELKAKLFPALTLKITPKLITTQQLLLLNNLELRQNIEEELLQNPVLEIDEEVQNTCLECGNVFSSGVCPNCGWKKEAQDISLAEVEYIEDILRQPQVEDDEQIYTYTPVPSQKVSISDYILLNLYPLEKKEREIAQILADNISEDGYLEIDVCEVAKRTGATFEKVNDVLKKIQTLEPPGIGARNLQEALLLQLENMQYEKSQIPQIERVKIIIEKHLDDLKKHNYIGISRSLNLSPDETLNAVEFIKHHLTPYPGRGIISASSAENIYLKPDIIIHKEGDFYRVEVVERHTTNLRINPSYLEMYKKMKNKFYDYSEEDFNHLKNYIERAKFYLKCLHTRHQTIKKIAEEVVYYQREFLNARDKEYLLPLTQTKISQITGFSPSTVSRAVSNKFVQLPWAEIAPFQMFFENAVSIKQQILQIIENEDKTAPLSDIQIAEILSKDGKKIARRTVTKYREELNIPPSHCRKKHNRD